MESKTVDDPQKCQDTDCSGQNKSWESGGKPVGEEGRMTGHSNCSREVAGVGTGSMGVEIGVAVDNRNSSQEISH